MKDAKELIPTSVLQQYAIEKVLCIKPISIGLIHQTFEIHAEHKQYIMQKLHPILASPEIASDFLAVTNFLKKKNFLAPECVLTMHDQVLARDGNDTWRMQTKIAGMSFDVVTQTTIAQSAGKIFGEFHQVMDAIDYQFQTKKSLHETEKIHSHFLDILEKKSSSPLINFVGKEIQILQHELPCYFLPSDFPLRVIHGDPKISNILFHQNQASAIIDLDTCNRRPLLVELGDLFRSWCGKRENDQNNKFSLPIFRAAWNGYKVSASGFLSKREIKYMPQAIGLITLELAARFLIDYFEDSYFGWDEKNFESRREHNIVRCRSQLSEFFDFKSKIKEIREIIE